MDCFLEEIRDRSILLGLFFILYFCEIVRVRFFLFRFRVSYIKYTKRKEICMNSYYERGNAEKSLAFAYVKWHKMEPVFESLSEAMQIGTLFPELEKPFVKERCKNGRK